MLGNGEVEGWWVAYVEVVDLSALFDKLLRKRNNVSYGVLNIAGAAGDFNGQGLTLHEGKHNAAEKIKLAKQHNIRCKKT